MTTETNLVLALWRFIENGGDSAEFFALRERVRQYATPGRGARAVPGRSVEITDEDENIVVAFVAADPKHPFNR
jgi:hypothetical protein